MTGQNTSHEKVPAQERIVNLALHLTRYGSSGFATRTSILGEVQGYGRYADCDDDKTAENFRRTFENDKRALREMGFVIEVDGDDNGYRIDMNRTFMKDLELTVAEATELKAIGTAVLATESFPFKRDLRLALAKIAGDQGWTNVSGVENPQPLPGTATAAPVERNLEQTLREALAKRHPVQFTYHAPGKDPLEHTVEVYGDFSHEEVWYVVGLDQALGRKLTFRVDRMSDVKVDMRSSYEIPADFKIEDYHKLPFQYGTENVEGRFVIVPERAPFSRALIRGKGSLVERDDGSLLWTVQVNDCKRAASWCIADGAGVIPISPKQLVDEYHATLVAAMEGGA